MSDTIFFGIVNHDVDGLNPPQQIYLSLENTSNVFDDEDHYYSSKSYLDLEADQLSYICGTDVLIGVGATETVETCPSEVFGIENSNHSFTTDSMIKDVTTDTELPTNSIEDAVRMITETTCFEDELNDAVNSISNENEPDCKKSTKKRRVRVKKKKTVSKSSGLKRGRKPFFGNNSKPKCNICDAQFTSTASLRNHMLTHSGERPFQCDLCEKSFTRATVLKIHRRLHTGEKPFECKLCSEGFVTKEALARHVLKQHPENAGPKLQKEKASHVCKVCNKSLCSKYSLQSHMNIHLLENKTKEIEAGIKCTICKKTLTCRYTLQRHVLEVHNQKGILTCNFCEMLFSSKWEYSKHQDVHVSRKKFECEICSKSFEKEFRFLYHLQVHEAEEISSINCFICKQEFSTKQSFMEHVRGYVQSEKPTYACPQCNYSFSDPRQLKLHLNEIHKLNSISDLNYCDICQVSLNNANHYYEHLFEKHDNLEIVCNVCNSLVKSRRQYDEHLTAHLL